MTEVDAWTSPEIADFPEDRSIVDPYARPERVLVPTASDVVRETLAAARYLPGEQPPKTIRVPPHAPKCVSFPYLGAYVVDDLIVTRHLPQACTRNRQEVHDGVRGHADP